MAITTPVSYYKLNESSGNAVDSVGSNTLTNTGTVTYVTGKINNCASETGSSYLSNTSNYGITGGAITIAGWVQMGAYVSGSNAFFGQSDSSTFTSYYIERTSSSNVNFYREKGGVTTQGASVTFTFSASTWYHLAITYDATTVKAYINGTLVGSGAASGSGSSSITQSGVTLNGRYYNSGTPINLTTELVDEVGIWNYALTDGQISQLYNGGKGSQYPFSNIGIAYDNATTASSSAVSSFTYSHTISSDSNRILFVGSGGHVSDIETGVTYNGVAMTLIGKTTNAGSRWSYLWYLINPASGANNVVITASGSMDTINTTAVSYTGVKQSGQPDNFTTTNTTAQNVTTTLTTVADNCWTIIASRNESIPSAGTGMTLRGSVSNQFIVGDSNLAITPAGSTSLTINKVSSASTGAVMASFAPAPTTVNSNFLMFM